MKKILLWGCLCTSIISNAQQGYVVSAFTSQYVQIENPITVPGTTDEPWDDPDFIVPIGFEFTMGGTSSDQVMQFGLGGDLSILSGFVTSIVGFSSDLIDASNIEGEAPSTITYATEGTVGNRIFKIQYTDCAFYDEVYPDEGAGSATNLINFQIWLYEIDHSIEFRFGPHTITDIENVFYGDPGPVLTVANDLSFMDGTFSYMAFISGVPSSPVLIPGDLEGEIYEPMNGVPENGRVIRLEQTVVSVTDNTAPNFNMYPTLASDFITIESIDLSASDIYRIYEISGRLIDSGSLTNGNRINVNHLSQGMYLIEIVGYGTARKFLKD